LRNGTTMSDPFESTEPIAKRVVDGVARISLALRSRAWRGATWEKLTPTQGHILALLRESREPLRLTDVAEALGVTPASASQAVASLVAKALISRDEAETNRRALALTLTDQGAAVADRVAGWTGFLVDAFAALTPVEQTSFLMGLLKVLRMLEVRGEISTARICLTCEYFRAMAQPWGSEKPHLCMFLDSPLADCQLRIGCPLYGRASPDLHEANWHALVARDEPAA
jgi:DNA-binding MarR family transcriptional regulator